MEQTLRNTWTKMFVSPGMEIKSVEVIDLNESRVNTTCEDIPDFPVKGFLIGRTGQLFRKTMPIICGGSNLQYSLCECHALYKGKWTYIASLKECRSEAQMVTLTYPDGKEILLIIGGATRSSILSTVELFDGDTWNLNVIAKMPQAIAGHCVVKINETTLMVIGGAIHIISGFTNHTYFYNLINNQWYPGPTIITPRTGHACGILNWRNPSSGLTEKVVIIAGGGTIGSGSLSSTELLFLDHNDDSSSGWKIGPNLPKTATLSNMVEYQNTVILVGGFLGVDGFHMYQLSSPSGTWTVMKQVLKNRGYYHVSFLIPDELVTCR